MQEVLIIGGGIIGCAIARELAKEGSQVTLFEAGNQVGREASGAAIGVLIYSPTNSNPKAWHSLANQSLLAHRKLRDQLQKELNPAPEWFWPGRLNAVTSQGGEIYSKERLNRDILLTGEGKWLKQEEIHELEPALGDDVLGGSFTPNQGWVNPGRLTDALAESAKQYGVKFEFQAKIEGLILEGARVVGVRAKGKEIRAKNIVIAAGAWSGMIDPRVKMPVEPVRGQAIYFDLDKKVPIRHLIQGSGIYMIPYEQGILIGATQERVGFDRRNTAGDVIRLIQKGIKILPLLEDVSWEKIHVRYGFRPGTPDAIPIIGPDRNYKGLFWATGHFKSGILLAPITATLITQLILENKTSELLTSIRN